MIRTAKPQDIPRIAEIMIFGKRVAYRPIFQDDFVSFNEMRVIDVIEKYNNDPACLKGMLVYDDGIVKGVLGRKLEKETVELTDFYVEPFFKGQGVGTKLIQYAIAQARETGRERMFLWVLEENTPARKFYEANGFINSKETRLVEGTEKTDMRYELVICPESKEKLCERSDFEKE
ncbi:MAG: GNAT family N-acetyltransferase [Lachnospiraceae bacterium]|nr:GNAT family N-acetyltransferase [Lachnospiraceae bacterium]